MRKALCIGVDAYPFGPLRGCVNDANAIADILSKHEDGSPNFECRRVLAPNPGAHDVLTVAKLRKVISDLFKDKADVALLHFSGHGTFNNLDGYLVTQDAKSYDEGVPMSQVLQLANDSKADEVVVILDCCHSGALGNAPLIDNKKALLREGVSILTASRDDQVSVEVGGGGIFTSLVVDALSGGAADLLGDVSAPSIYSSVEMALGAWDQRPLFKSHVSKLFALRKCRPAIDIAILRELPTLFPVPAEDLPLSPEYESTSGQTNPEKNAVFEKLICLSRVQIVVPVGEAHMYDAAVKSKACRLTASGRYYWRLANSGHI